MLLKLTHLLSTSIHNYQIIQIQWKLMKNQKFMFLQNLFDKNIIIPKQIKNKNNLMMINETGNNLTSNYTQRKGNMRIMGNNNTLNLKECQLIIQVFGNGNTFQMNNCKIELHIGGNGNNFLLSNTALKIGFKGNGNQIKINNSIQHSQDNCQITIIYNQGSYNTFPPSSVNHGNSPPIRNNNNISSNSFRNQSRNNPMIWQNAQYTQNFGNMEMYSPPPRPINNPNVFNPFSILRHNMEQQKNIMDGIQNITRYNQQLQYQNNPSNNANSSGNLFNSTRVNNTRNNRNQNGNTNRASKRVSRANSDNTNYFANNVDRYNDGRNQSRGVQIVQINTSDEEEDDIQLISQQQNNSNSRRGGGGTRFNFNQQLQPRYAFNQSDSVRGLTDQQLSKLRSSKYEGKVMNCSICLLDIVQGNEVLFLFCFHSFHSNCVKAWLKKSGVCPLCQLDLTSLLSQ